MHGITFGGHPVQSRDRPREHRDHAPRAHRRERRRERGRASARRSPRCSSYPIAGDLRGAGYFYAIELVKDKETRETFDAEESRVAPARLHLEPRSSRQGLICRADDRGDPVIQISPPLIAGQAEFDKIAGILGDVLTEAWDRIR